MPTSPLTIDQQMTLLLRGTDHVYTAEELKNRLEQAARTGRQLRIKLGMDPTAPDLHLGHSVVLQKMRQFQDLGHKAVLIIGDATAMIGDPTGKKKTRPVLTREEVDLNAKTYFAQAGKILDLSPGKLEIRRNSEWLHKMSFVDSLKLCQKMTVARMLERDTFQDRYKAGEAIYIHEFMYPLMQGWDSVMTQSDVELGGTDQTFNNLVGRDLQESEGQPPQIVMIMPILVGTDGTQKMSKSLGNYIGVSDPPGEQFGKAMSIPDNLMDNWFRLLTPLPDDRIRSLVNPQTTHPRQAKETLGRAIVEQYHSAAAAEKAAEDFRKRFTEHQVLADTEVKTIPAAALTNGKIGIMALIKEVGFASSTSEAKRLIQGGAVTFAGTKISDFKLQVAVTGNEILQVGKLKICKVRIQ
ncbi:MAG: tyrosine--tRNA ligase [Phycisphaerales bacterium]|nr:tyrosine--tRNA ligase [Phycisphaerales bacterium]